jgi:hypothetical protein
MLAMRTREGLMSYVMDYLQGRGVTFTVIPHPKAATAAGEAMSCTCPRTRS